jgi:hypothetical protein
MRTCLGLIPFVFIVLTHLIRVEEGIPSSLCRIASLVLEVVPAFFKSFRTKWEGKSGLRIIISHSRNCSNTKAPMWIATLLGTVSLLMADTS